MHNYSPCSKNPPSSLAFIPRALFRQFPPFRLGNSERVRGHFFGVRGALLPASSNMRLIRHEKCHRREGSRDEGGEDYLFPPTTLLISKEERASYPLSLLLRWICNPFGFSTNSQTSYSPILLRFHMATTCLLIWIKFVPYCSWPRSII